MLYHLKGNGSKPFAVILQYEVQVVRTVSCKIDFGVGSELRVYLHIKLETSHVCLVSYLNTRSQHKGIGREMSCCVPGIISGDMLKFTMDIPSTYRNIQESGCPIQMPYAPMSKVCAGKQTKT